MKTFAFETLATADLVVDAVYDGGTTKSVAADPLSRLLPGVGNQGGFRAAGSRGEERFVVLYTSGEDVDWPDLLDISAGQFVYFGDNKTPGHELHDTKRGGNRLLRSVFESLHSTPALRSRIPPFFVFRKFPNAASPRSVQFKGIAAPGFPALSATEDLVAIWKAASGQRFQNYRAVFTILDVPVVHRKWIEELSPGTGSSRAPKAWSQWVATGRYVILSAEPTTNIRSIEKQVPDTPGKQAVLHCVWSHFKDSPVAFEGFAALVYQMTDQRVIVDLITRGGVDGGRDAIGRYLLGVSEDPVYAEFALEAKCYRPSHISPASILWASRKCRG
jgi:hypothetical protein